MSLERISTTFTRVDPTYRYYYLHPISNEKTFLTDDQISYLELMNTYICNQLFSCCAYFQYNLKKLVEITAICNQLIEARDFILHSILCIPTSYTGSPSFTELASKFYLHFAFSVSKEDFCASNPPEVQIGWQLDFLFHGNYNGRISDHEVESPPFLSLLQSLHHVIRWIEACKERDPLCYEGLYLDLQKLILEAWEITNINPNL